MVSQCSERAGEQSKTLYPTDMWEKEASAIETVYSKNCESVSKEHWMQRKGAFKPWDF